MATPRLQALQRMAAKLPSSKPADSGLAVQQLVGAAPAGPPVGPGQAQRAAAGLTAQAGQQNVAQTQRQVQHTGQVARQLGQEAGHDTKLKAMVRDRQQQAKMARAERRLAGIDRDVANQMFRENLQFQRDQAGRLQLNQNQTMDLMVATAENEEDAKDRIQKLQNAYLARAAMAEGLYRRLEQAMKSAAEMSELKKMGYTKAQIAALARDAKEAAAARRTAANRSAAFGSALGGIAGAGIGALTGSPAVAAVGYQIGSGFGAAAS